MIPIYKSIQRLLESYKGNFGLWFNKFVELSEKDNKYKPSSNAIETYKAQYDQIKNYTAKLLEKKHISHYNFCESVSSQYEKLTLTAKLTSPLIVGIGETHPNEVGMTFDHTIGIPYIPASSIKGIVRFVHTIFLVEEAIKKNEIKRDKYGNEYFDDEADWTKIDEIFGKGGDKGNKGKVIFLDAYPEIIPELHKDIMNPHYGDYYSDEHDKKPPADYLTPKPIKFLTVKRGSKFIFRILISKEISEELFNIVKKAVIEALTIEGVGAKTSLGYGLFEIEKWEESEDIINAVKKFKELEEKRKIEIEKERLRKEEEEKISKMSEVEKKCYILLKNKNENFSYELYNELDKYDDKDKLIIAKALKEFWKSIGKWGKGISKKQKEKNKKIEKILNNR